MINDATKKSKKTKPKTKTNQPNNPKTNKQNSPQNVIKCYDTHRDTKYGINDHSCLLLDFRHSANTKIDMKSYLLIQS